MTRSRYDLTYGELSMSPLDTNVKASTTGSGLYVGFWQNHTDALTGEQVSEHILLFPEQIQPLIDFLTQQQKDADKADHSWRNIHRKLVEVHGFDTQTADIILLDAEENGAAQFVSEKVFDDEAKTRRVRYVVKHDWSGEHQMDYYTIEVERQT